jgi:tripeptide aminopeptidase
MRAYERLLQYVAFDTTSDENAPEDRCPSSEGQTIFGIFLVEEMKRAGLTDAHADSDGYLYGTLPANCGQTLPAIGLIAHMDTSSAVSGANIRPRIVKNYGGGDLILNPEGNRVLRASENPDLSDYVGMDLIVTDGTTLLGADDKAGIAEILTAVEELVSQNIPHGKISVGFTPDEEIGRGADRFDVKGFGADFAYTVDGGKIGELEYENFNAAEAVVTVAGISTHPGDAKNKMQNALLYAAEFNSLLPASEIPACTEGYEGFYHLMHMAGDVERAELRYIIRDHDRAKFEARKDRLLKIAAYLNEKYGEHTFELKLRDSYYNMKEKIEPHPEIIERAVRAMEEAGMKPKSVPIRGGTDGARLSFMGLPCPNLPTGGHNFHGRYEYIPVQAMDQMAQVLVNLVRAPQEAGK